MDDPQIGVGGILWSRDPNDHIGGSSDHEIPPIWEPRIFKTYVLFFLDFFDQGTHTPN